MCEMKINLLHRVKNKDNLANILFYVAFKNVRTFYSLWFSNLGTSKLGISKLGLSELELTVSWHVGHGHLSFKNTITPFILPL